MKETMTRALTRGRTTFNEFTNGQKVVAIIGTAALLIGAFMVFRWASTPSYAPLYSDLSGSDASAVIEELEAKGIPYEITGGGGTIMVPRGDVYSTRIALSGEGLPSSSGKDGYGLLDEQSISTSEFQEQTDYKRAMEGELAATVEAIDSVDTAIVHLALPEKQVFASEQDPPTASVLVDTAAGSTLDDGNVEAIVHLVASSIDGLDPKDVTVTDAAGRVLTSPDDPSGFGGLGDQQEQVQEFEQSMQTKVQQAIDTWLGPGNSTTTVTAVLDFDRSTTDTREYNYEKGTPPLSQTESSETYTGPGGAGAAGDGGIVGPDGQMDPPAEGEGGDSAYENRTGTTDNAVGETVEHREAAPGSVESTHIGVVLDQAAATGVDPATVEQIIRDATGIDPQQGDTIEVTTIPFDRTAAEAAAEELAAAKAADAAAAKKALWRNVAIGFGIALMVLLAWWQARRRAAAREEATTYVIEQLRADAAARVPVEAPAVAALEAADEVEDDRIRDDLIALVERQPDDVAALLRGWLVEPR